MAFKPKGEKALWEHIYEHIKDGEIDAVYTYDDLSGLIDEDITKNRQPVYRARKELALRNKKYLVSARGVGYRLIEGKDMLIQAESRMAKAERQTKFGNFEAVNINTGGMTVAQKNEVRQFLAWNGMVLSSLSHNARQISEFQETTSNMVNDKLAELTGTMEAYSRRMDELSKKVK
jgi:hypothetical protein